MSWQADTPDHTSLGLQVRAGVVEAHVADAEWVGPDGTDETWFEESPSDLPREPDGFRHWQVRVRFDRERPVYGPVLDAVTLEVGPQGQP